MKTNYRPKSRARSGKPFVVIVVSVFIAGAIIFSLFDRTLITVVSPLWQGRNAVSRGAMHFLSMWKFKGSLVTENESLKERVAVLEAENLTGNAAVSREEELLGSLGRIINTGKVASTVISRPPETPYDVIIIDAGDREGLEVGQRVSIPEGGLLGHIEEVLSRSSRVRLSTSNGEKTNAILERGYLPVILEGHGGGNFKLILPRDTSVEIGDRILSPYIEASLIGIVESVELRPTDSFKEVLVRSPANIQMIRFVIVH